MSKNLATNVDANLPYQAHRHREKEKPTELPPLWAHQKKGIELGLQKPELGIFFEVGTGKSRTAIDIVRHRCAAKGALMRTLILAPKIVCTNWKEEFERYSKIHPRDILVLLGPGKKRCMKFKEAVLDESLQLTKPKIIITNYESFDAKMVDFFSLLYDWKPEVMIADEAHRLKNPESKRAKQVIKLSDKVQNKLALTGTPILNSAMDIFNIYRFLDAGKSFGTNFWKFRAVWFEDENAKWNGKPGYFPKFVPRPEAYAEFNSIIYKKAVRAKKSECLDLPPFVRKEVNVELSPEQARLYKEMRDQYIAYIDDITKTDTPRAVVAQLAITKAQRLMQILTGYAKTEEGEIHKIKDNPRLDALKELLEDLAPDHKIIVWSIYHENYADIRQVCEDLKLGYAEMHGLIKDKDAERKRFETDPNCRVMVSNQQAGGIGINLTMSDVSIYYSKNFSLEQDIQSEGRNYRGGSEKHESVTRIDITVKDTIDALIDEALRSKQRISDLILDWKEKL